MNKADIEEWIAHPNAGLNRITISEFKALAELALRNMRAGFSVPQGEPVAYVWDEATYPDDDVRGRGWREVMGRHHPNHPAMTRNVVQLYAAPPADGVDDLTEQCRLNGMGQEREARLMAEVTELKSSRNVLVWQVKNREAEIESLSKTVEALRAKMKEGGE